jgi:hypothetical protein
MLQVKFLPDTSVGLQSLEILALISFEIVTSTGRIYHDSHQETICEEIPLFPTSLLVRHKPDQNSWALTQTIGRYIQKVLHVSLTHGFHCRNKNSGSQRNGK